MIQISPQRSCVWEKMAKGVQISQKQDGIIGVLEYPGEQDITSPQQLDNHEECAGCAGYQTVHEAARESHGADCEAGQESEQDIDINPICALMDKKAQAAVSCSSILCIGAPNSIKA